jgi:hypothetical protein
MGTIFVVIQPPVLCPVRVDQKIQAATVRQLVRLSFWLGIPWLEIK